MVDRCLVLAVIQFDDGDIGVLGETQDFWFFAILDEEAEMLLPGIGVRIAEIQRPVGMAVLEVDGDTGADRLMVEVPNLVTVLVRTVFDLFIGQVEPAAMQVDAIDVARRIVNGQDVVRILRQPVDDPQAAGAAHIVFDLV